MLNTFFYLRVYYNKLYSCNCFYRYDSHCRHIQSSCNYVTDLDQQEWFNYINKVYGLDLDKYQNFIVISWKPLLTGKHLFQRVNCSNTYKLSTTDNKTHTKRWSNITFLNNSLSLWLLCGRMKHGVLVTKR